MPLYDNNNAVKVEAPTPASNPSAAIIDTASIYSSLQASGVIVPYLDGTPWTVTYYNQYIDNDSVVINSNDVDDPTIKQLMRINSFELRVTEKNVPKINQSTGTSAVTGSSNVYPVITPLIGDVFFGLIENNSTGVFEITGIERLSLFKESAWSITYNLIGYLDDSTQASYDQYVVSSFTFDLKALQSGANPIKTDSETYQNQTKNQVINDLIDKYYSQFYDRLTKTFTAPNIFYGTGILYDPFVVKFWNTFINEDIYQTNIQPMEYNVSSGILIRPIDTIFTAIEKQSIMALNNAVVNMSIWPSSVFLAPYLKRTIYESNINFVVYPTEQSYLYTTTGNDSITQAQTEYDQLMEELTGTTQQYSISDNPALIIPYILTNNFYTNTGTMSPLEIQIRKLINKETIAYSDIQPIIDDTATQSLLKQFYYYPLLLILLMVSR